MPKKLTILEGDRFGEWTVIKEVEPIYYGNKKYRIFLCRCSCGAVKELSLMKLRGPRSNKCRSCATRETKTTHGCSDTRLYRVWKGMKYRCYNENFPSYSRYGGRGIGICKEWKNTFAVFKKWAEKTGYREPLTIERINNDKGYSPENCKWIPKKDQSLNRNSRRELEYNGVKKSVKEWAEEYGMKYDTLWMRLKRGWEIGKSISYPVNKNKGKRAEFAQRNMNGK